MPTNTYNWVSSVVTIICKSKMSTTEFYFIARFLNRYNGIVKGRFGSIGLVLSPVFTRFVITSSYLYKVSCLIYIICVCLRAVVSSITHCVVLLLGLSSSCVLCVASFSGLSIFDSPFGILKRLLTS
jgi:hypothetical protein